MGSRAAQPALSLWPDPEQATPRRPPARQGGVRAPPLGAPRPARWRAVQLGVEVHIVHDLVQVVKPVVSVLWTFRRWDA